MKVLHVINELNGGGAQSLLKDIVRVQRSNGVDVEVLTFVSVGNVFEELIVRSCINIHCIGVKNIYNPMYIFRLIRYISKYDIVHVHLFPAQYYAIIASFFVRHKPIFLFTEHGTKNNRIGKLCWRLIDKIIYARYDKIICVSQAVFRSITKWVDIPAEKFSVVVNGTQLINAEPKWTDSQEKTSILMVAMFNEYKDQATVIRSAVLLGNKYHFFFAGSGHLESKMKALARELGVSDRVHFLGFQKSVSEVISSADICVLSSHWEAFGLSAIECMVAAKPLIASNVDGLRQVVEGAGLLFEKGNASELANLIERLANSKNFYLKTAQACKERAQEYSIEKTAAKYVDIYSELLLKQKIQ